MQPDDYTSSTASAHRFRDIRGRFIAPHIMPCFVSKRFVDRSGPAVHSRDMNVTGSVPITGFAIWSIVELQVSPGELRLQQCPHCLTIVGESSDPVNLFLNALAFNIVRRADDAVWVGPVAVSRLCYVLYRCR